MRTHPAANLAHTVPHQIAYQHHLEELTARLAQLAGPDFTTALAYVDHQRASRHLNRIQALNAAITLLEGAAEEPAA
jgi:hypothetical protein